MRPRLYLHIGHPKVASSSIQVALGQNIDALRERGFLVADEAMRFPESGPLNGMPVQFVADCQARRDEGLRDAFARFQDAHQQLGDSFDKLIVSAESLSMPHCEFLAKELKQHFEVHVLYYIRRQDEWLASAWNQWGSKEGLDLAAFCERQIQIPEPNYEAIIARFRPVADALYVRPLHRSALTDSDVVADMFAAISAGFDPVRPQRANETFDLALLEVWASSGYLFDSIRDNELREWIRGELPERFPIERAAMHPDLSEQIRASFEEQNRRLHAAHFADVDYDAVFGPRPDTAARQQAHDDQQDAHATIDRLRRIVGLQFGMLHDLHQRIRDLEERG